MKTHLFTLITTLLFLAYCIGALFIFYQVVMLANQLIVSGG